MKFYDILSICIAFLLITGCDVDFPATDQGPDRLETAADADTDAISFELAGQNEAALVVPTYINGDGPYQFVLDTGATLTCLNTELSEELDLPEQEGQYGIGATIEGTGPVRFVEIDSMRVGHVTAHHMSACEINLAHMEQVGLQVDGLIGLNFLRSFRVTLDFGDNTLRLDEL